MLNAPSCAIVALRHIAKNKGNGDARAAGLGSIDLRAAARSVLLIGQDPDDENQRAIVQTKNNLGPLAEPLGYQIRDGNFFWTGKSRLTSARILSNVADEETRGAKREAEEFLRERLANGMRPVTEVRKDARAAGISERTLRRAREGLGVKSRKGGGHFGGDPGWQWELPEDDRSAPEDSQINNSGRLQAIHSNKSSYSNEFAEGDQHPEFGRLQDSEPISSPGENWGEV